jgi:DNA-binding HxlR family transcriptional regulator
VREPNTMPEEEGPCTGPECGATIAIEVIGSELKLTVLHSLLSGPKRFNELRLVTGICQSSLAKTLKDLEDAGIAERKVHLDRPLAVEYRLSPKGQDLFEAIRELEAWASRWVMVAGDRGVTQ